MNRSIFLTFMLGVYCLANKIKKFKLDVPAVIYHDFELFTIGDDVQSRSKIECAAICFAKENCIAFQFKASDHLEKLCYNTTPSQFIGRINTTVYGTPCKPNWTPGPTLEISDNSFPDISMAAAKNYCRDPKQEGYLWCLQEILPFGYIFESCNIPKCMNLCFDFGTKVDQFDQLIDNCRMYSRVLSSWDDFYLAVDGISYFTPQI